MAKMTARAQGSMLRWKITGKLGTPIPHHTTEYMFVSKTQESMYPWGVIKFPIEVRVRVQLNPKEKHSNPDVFLHIERLKPYPDAKGKLAERHKTFRFKTDSAAKKQYRSLIKRIESTKTLRGILGILKMSEG
jgi:hypothetical protein